MNSDIVVTSPYDLLFWLKVSSLGIGAFLGMVGTMGNFRDDHGHLTLAGKLTLIALAVAAGVGIVAQQLDTLDTEKQWAKLMKESDQTAIDTKKTLEQSAASVNSLQELVGKSNDLIDKTNANLEVERKTNASVNGTLLVTQRALETVDDTIKLEYALAFRINNERFERTLDTLDEKLDAIPKQWHIASDKELQEDLDQKGGITEYEGKRTTELRMTTESVLLTESADPIVKLVVSEVPFEIFFSHHRPAFARECDTKFAPAENWVGYSWNLQRTHELPSGFPEPLKQTAGKFLTKTLSLTYTSPPRKLVQMGEVTFGTGQRGGFISALDFRRAYMRVQLRDTGNRPGADFDELWITIGAHILKIPLRYVTYDKCGGFIYQLPRDLESLRLNPKVFDSKGKLIKRRQAS